MIHPDQPPAPKPRKLGAKGMALVVAGLVVGGLVLGGLTGSSPQSETSNTSTPPILPTTPTTAPLVVEQGIPFAWEQLLPLPSRYVLAITRWNDEILLFAAKVESDLPTGLEVYAISPSDDGSARELATYRGVVIDPMFTVQQVSATPAGLFAVGAHMSTGKAHVWSSDDGVTWTDVDFPNSGSLAILRVHHVGENLLLVGYQPARDLNIAMYMEAERRYGRRAWPNINTSGSDITMTVFGPLGIPYLTLTPADLDLDPADFDPPEPGFTEMLVRDEDGTWASTRMPENSFLNTVFTGPDGRLWAGWGPGEQNQISEDGIHWRPGGPTQGFWVEPWGDGWVRHQDRDDNIAFTVDGETWTYFDFPDFAIDPNSPLQVGPFGPAARTLGEKGIGIVTGQPYGEAITSIPINDPLTFERDGYTLAISSSMLRLLDGEAIVVSLNRHGAPSSDQVRVDPETETLTFHNDVGEPLVTFTFEELEAFERLELETTRTVTPSGGNVFLYSPDGTDWTVQILDDAISGELPWILTFIDDRVYLVYNDWYRNSTTAARGTSVWTAGFPDG